MRMLREALTFLADHDMVSLYKSYDWGNDQWRSGFRDIVAMEESFRRNVLKGIITAEDIMAIVYWGRLPNPKQVSCPTRIEITSEDLVDPASLLRKLSRCVVGLGPTYLSKVIRFACPERAGAIDTRLVRVFGKGDPKCATHDWLRLKVSYNGRWFISKTGWQSEYSRWLGLLNEMKDSLNSQGAVCPHPETFIGHGLREKGKWTCADVEMALFAYSSRIVS